MTKMGGNGGPPSQEMTKMGGNGGQGVLLGSQPEPFLRQPSQVGNGERRMQRQPSQVGRSGMSVWG